MHTGQIGLPPDAPVPKQGEVSVPLKCPPGSAPVANTWYFIGPDGKLVTEEIFATIIASAPDGAGGWRTSLNIHDAEADGKYKLRVYLWCGSYEGAPGESAVVEQPETKSARLFIHPDGGPDDCLQAGSVSQWIAVLACDPNNEAQQWSFNPHNGRMEAGNGLCVSGEFDRPGMADCAGLAPQNYLVFEPSDSTIRHQGPPVRCLTLQANTAVLDESCKDRWVLQSRDATAPEPLGNPTP